MPARDAKAENQPLDPEPARVWTDQAGRSFVARFVGMKGTRVELLKDRLRFSHPFTFFSPADQQYVRDEMNRRGQGHVLPSQSTEPAAPSFVPGEPAIPPSDTSPVEPAAVPWEPQPSAHGFGMKSNESQPASAASGSPESAPSSSGPSQPAAPESASQTVYLCKNCDGELPSDFQLGQRCPHCNARIVYEQGGDGGVAGFPGIAASRWPILVGGGIGALVIIVILLRVIAAATRN
ncbi:MAG: hypothetical protein HUU20_20960 [Pirellulales bacterium]|nr:hypothetical protein [Pirellulales bacterium]